MNCKLCSDLLQEYLENTLSQEVIDELNKHIEVCTRCKIFFKTYTLTVTLSKKIETPCCISTDMMDRLKSLLYNKLFHK